MKRVFKLRLSGDFYLNAEDAESAEAEGRGLWLRDLRVEEFGLAGE
jgi:hypothetical protein